MVFSSPVFLFVFLPFVWLVHAMLPEKARKPFLLLASLLFYMYGEGPFTLLMAATILTAYETIRLIQRSEKRRTLIAAIGSAIAIGILLVFKYANFFTSQLAPLLARFSIDIAPTSFHLPLGISFFTFQALSCIIDFYRKPSKEHVSLLDTALYISFFPQLVAGPIVRYDSFIPQLRHRAVHYAAFLYGIRRFVYGFAKKVLISNNLAPVVEKIYSMNGSEMGTSLAWMAPFLFGIELYFDFSGYSDMAIGLARMFGIKIPENFRYPFAATSMTNLWRRWHISLSTWFRDYLYFPLGGSRKGDLRTMVNLCIVFLVCGLWHGAAWNFVLFGAISALFMVCERLYRKYVPFRNVPLSHLYVILIVFPAFFGSFRANTVTQYFSMVHAMFVPQSSSVDLAQLFDTKAVIAAAAGILLGFPIYEEIAAKCKKSNIFKLLEAVVLVLLFAAALSSSTIIFSDPFIYFRF